MIPRYLVSFDTDTLPALKSDVLVVGSGVAGLSAALRLAGVFDVILVTKSGLETSTTMYAQGGIAGVMAEYDSPGLHLKDTLVAGAGLSDPEATSILVEEGPARIMELLELYDVDFDMEGGKLSLAKEGGHSRPRVVHAKGDATGFEVERSLGRAFLKQEHAAVMEHAFVVDIMACEGRCAGALVVDTARKTMFVVWSQAVILASGGMGHLFLVTTNPPICTGDGVSMAFRAGASVSDVEFVQFHPTALHIPEEPKFLISEAIRGEGAFIVDADGNRIMEGFHPLGELAPRDIVVARMLEVMKEQEQNHLYLDVRHLDPGLIRRRFPHIYEHCLQAGIDITRHLIPVSPAAHYMSGGVVTDLCGRTDIPGLYACGETACTGVHGANRLASNSLLEGLVFAKRITDDLHETLEPGAGPRPVRVFYGHRAAGPRVREELLTGNLREIMRDHVGMERCARGLKEAIEFIEDNSEVLRTEYLDRPGMELKNMLILAYLIANSARIREESRGCHRRRDFPDTDEWKWRRHIDVQLADGYPSVRLRTQRSRRQPELKTGWQGV